MPDEFDLRAESIGALVPVDRWRGVVDSVYPAALNLLHPDGYLVSILHDPGTMHAYGVLVPGATISPESNRMYAGLSGPQVAVGDEVVCASGAILVGNTTAVSVSGARSWSGRLPRRLASLTGLSTVELLAQALRRWGAERGMAAVVVRRIDGPILRAIAKILDGIDTGAAGRGGDASLSRADSLIDVSALVGVGEGLTPAGDDFISGVLLGAALCPQGPRIDLSAIEARLARTNRPGRTVLLAAIADEFPAYIHPVALALAGSETGKRQNTPDRPVRPADEEARVSAAVERAVRHGATSGSDTCAGLLWYLDRALMEVVD